MRTITYYVGGLASVYPPEDWQRLAAHLPHLNAAKVPQFQAAEKCRPQGNQVGHFVVQRTDRRFLTQAERDSLFWFFRGVTAALGITPQTV